MRIDDKRVVVHPLSNESRVGLVVRWAHAVALLDATSPDALISLLDLLGEEPEPRDLAGAIRECAAQSEVTAVGAVVEAPGGPWTLLRGAVELHAGDDRFVGTADGGERQLPEDQDALHLSLVQPGAGGEWTEPPTTPDLQELIDPFDLFDLFDLTSGAVAGSVVSVLPRQRISSPPPLLVENEPALVVAPFDFVDLRAVATPPRAEPLAITQAESGAVSGALDDASDELVRGILCSRDHFNDPRAAFCMVCGISMVHLTHNLVEGRRPTLGFLVFDDGSTFTLDRSYVLGREPGEPDEPGVDGLVVPDPQRQTVSRRHAEIRLDEWAVQLVDLGSTNGSFIWNETTNAWESASPNSEVDLAPGVTVALGRRTFIFESVHRV